MAYGKTACPPVDVYKPIVYDALLFANAVESSFTMSTRDFLAHVAVASCTSGRNCVAKARIIPCVTSPVLVNDFVAGIAFASNREAACTASPSQ